MADPRRLYDPVVHYGYRAIPGAILALMPVALYGMARDGAELWVLAAAAAMPIVIAIVLSATFWRTRPLHATATHLLVGRGPTARQIPFTDLASLDRPWWAFNPVFAAHVLLLRDGTEILFFPAPGAEALLRGRLSVRSVR
jgi:hypothetical protein